jgi:hypothetical protein
MAWRAAGWYVVAGELHQLPVIKAEHGSQALEDLWRGFVDLASLKFLQICGRDVGLAGDVAE